MWLAAATAQCITPVPVHVGWHGAYHMYGLRTRNVYEITAARSHVSTPAPSLLLFLENGTMNGSSENNDRTS
jgi:hypothetical protein